MIILQSALKGLNYIAEDTEFFSLSFPQVKQSDTYDYKYVRLFVTKNNKPPCPLW